MRAPSLIFALSFFCACASSQPPPAPSEPAAEKKEAPPAAAPAELIAADTPKETAAGNSFIAPVEWKLSVRAPATILEAPEGDSWLVLVDVPAADADAALALAWSAYDPNKKWPLKATNDAPDRDGWSKIRRYDYQTSPNEKRDVAASTRTANNIWTVVLYDMSQATGEKRSSQVGLVLGKLLPKGVTRESFAGKKANILDAARIAELGKFVETARTQAGVPGVSIGVVQNGKVVFSGGFGLRELGKKEKVDGDTGYLIASNTKGLTTLMLGKLVDEKKMTWETPATSLLPSFKLGDADTTGRVQVKHLICACTGMPRQDYEWLMQYAGVTPDGVMTTLGTMQPTSKFGELFQYSNPLAAAAGFIGGHVAFPKLELGKAYDQAMQTRVFDPLGMKSTTFDAARARKKNFAQPHAPDVDGKTTLAMGSINDAIIPVRPAGGAWSTVNDVLKYVQMELDEGKLPNGKVYLSKEALFARREPQVAVTNDGTYGMGLFVDHKYGVTVVHHGGDMIGYHSDMMWIPEHNVGAVVLTNGDPGWLIRTLFRRKLLEVLFDGNPEADKEMAAAAKNYADGNAVERKLMTIPPDAAEVAKLAARYTHPSLGEIAVKRSGDTVVFDFGEWKSEMASRKNPDGTISFLTTAPGIVGFEFVVGAGAQKTLIARDAQHEYVFTEKV